MINKQIKKYRELRNLTQEELANRLFVSPKTIGHYETGVRNCEKLETLKMLTKELGFSILIKNGKIYLEGDFEMINKENIKATLLNKYKESYIYYTKWFIYGKNHKCTEEEEIVVNNMFDALLTSDVSKIVINNKLITIETALYTDEEEKYYFLDFRGFEDISGEMIEAYIEIYHKDTLMQYEEYVDDVWSFADWETVS